MRSLSDSHLRDLISNSGTSNMIMLVHRVKKLGTEGAFFLQFYCKENNQSTVKHTG